MNSSVALISTAYSPKPVAWNSALIRSIKAFDSSAESGAGKYFMTSGLLFISAKAALSLSFHERRISRSVSMYTVAILQVRVILLRGCRDGLRGGFLRGGGGEKSACSS